jgi:hypothetical protein
VASGTYFGGNVVYQIGTYCVPLERWARLKVPPWSPERNTCVVYVCGPIEKLSDFGPDCRVLHVNRGVWGGQEQAPKTSSAIRVVDLSQPLAWMVREFVANKQGYLFATANGKPLQQRNVLRASHATGRRVGFHAFRRYRAGVLRKAQVPEDLIGLWLGHAQNLTDRYAGQLREDVAYRAAWCKRAGLGFSVVTLVTQNVAQFGARRVA